jgi:hypothetical protein
MVTWPESLSLSTTMRPTKVSLVRIIPRTAIIRQTPPHIPAASDPAPTRSSTEPPTSTSPPALHPKRKIRIVPAPPSFHELKRSHQTLIDIMTARQRAGEQAGTWPANLRIEPIVTRKTLSGLKKGVMGRLRGLLKEE